MARRVFISFRFSDGKELKDELCDCFDQNNDIINCSENKDRSQMTDETIKEYLYDKLSATSVTIVIITPDAINYRKTLMGSTYDDWLYDELRYSLEDRVSNRTNAVIGVYTEEASSKLFIKSIHNCSTCGKDTEVNSMKEFDNLVRKNMMNVKPSKKKNPCEGIYDSLDDSYCSLIAFNEFKDNIDKYIDNAIEKRERIDDFNIVKRM